MNALKDQMMKEFALTHTGSQNSGDKDLEHKVKELETRLNTI
jgi:hypothetical protein